MVDVICDTSFLIQLATARIKNLDTVGMEIGNLEFVVPEVVKDELERLAKDPNKRALIVATQNNTRDFRTVPISGKFADPVLIKHAKTNSCMIGTMDNKLKKQIKAVGGTILSLSNNKIVLEP